MENILELFENGSLLPSEIIMVIMARYSVKDLLQYKLVSKNWYRSISDHRFVRKHYKISKQRSRTLLHKVMDLRQVLVNSFHFIDCNVRMINNLQAPVELFPQTWIKIIGSVNGLICFKHVVDPNSSSLVVWNPMTKVSRTIEDIGKDKHVWVSYYGIGCEFENLRQKLVVVYARIDQGRGIWWFFTCNLRDSFWKDDKSVPFADIFFDGDCATLNNSLFWRYSARKNGVMKAEGVICFNLTIESFSKIAVPQDVLNNNAFLAIHEDRLAYLSYDRNCEKNYCVDIWILELTGSSEYQWSKLYSLGPIDWLDKSITILKNELLLMFHYWETPDEVNGENGCILSLWNVVKQGVNQIILENDERMFWFESLWIFAESLAGVEESYPSELNAFLDKRLLFKIQIKDMHIKNNWRIYPVLKMTADEVLIDKFIAKSHAGQEFVGRDETVDLTQSSQQVGDNIKDSMSDETEVVSPNKIPLKRLAAESIIEANVDSSTLEKDPTAQMSSNKMKKTIKIEKD